MQPEFSEFSYAFAFTHEYINSLPGLKAAPSLPSLISEAAKGYDLKLRFQGHPKFFQFKLASYLDRKSTLHWDFHLQPHYRIPLRTRARHNQPQGTDQHSLLKQLARIERDVYYIAPRFHRSAEFNDLFLWRQVTKSSVWLPLGNLPIVTTDEAHYITFAKGSHRLFWHSEPMEIEGRFTAEEHYQGTGDRTTIDENYFLELRVRLLAVLRESGVQGLALQGMEDDNPSVLRDVHRLLTTWFGVEMVILLDERDHQEQNSG